MKKVIVFLIFAILLISFMAFVMANEQGKGNQNQNVNAGNDTENQNEEQEQECVEKDNSCCIGNNCKKTSKYCGENLTNFEGCDKNCKPIFSCKVRKEKIDFVPYQKKNESECLEGCKCRGAVMSCPTENGKIMTIEAGRSGKIITITVNKTEANTTLELEQEGNKTANRLKVKLSNGRKAEIKIMPDTASERARERLGDLNFTVQLKEVSVGKNKILAYEIQAERHYKLLGLFTVKAWEKAQVDAEKGDIIITKKPWWAFLARRE